MNNETKLKRIWIKLAKHLPKVYQRLDICISVNRVGIAVSHKDGVNIGVKVLKLRDEGIAMILGHELGHIVLGHVRDETALISHSASIAQERDCDVFGLFLCQQAGYSVTKCAEAIRLLLCGLKTNKTHGSGRLRFLEISKQVEFMENLNER